MKYFLVGIKGTGMAGLACYLKDKGEDVEGVDYQKDYFTSDVLRIKNIKVYSFEELTLNKEHIYIISNAYHKYNNFIVNKIIVNKYQYYYYHEFISNLDYKFICVTGTHGKTTTTKLLTNMLDKKCNYIIGDGTGGAYNNDLFIVECCEYKSHFLTFHPHILLINNNDLDHPDYYKSLKQLKDNYRQLSKESTITILNNDLVKGIKANKNVITYGFKRNSNYIIKIVKTCSNGYEIKLKHQNSKLNLFIPYLGKHMIYNYVGALLCVYALNKEPTKTLIDLPKRRLDITLYKNAILVNDYAHHPKEINALYETLRLKYPMVNIVCIFQSHTYERTIKYRKAFYKVLKRFDDCYLLDVFPSQRQTYNKEKQCYIDHYFKKFKKFTSIYQLDFNRKTVYAFVGAGNTDNIFKEIINKK